MSDGERRRRFDVLFASYSSDVVAYCSWRAASASDAQDAVAEVFLTAWRRLEELPEGDAALRPRLIQRRRSSTKRFGPRAGDCTARGVDSAPLRGVVGGRTRLACAASTSRHRRRIMNTTQSFEALRRANPRAKAGFAESVDAAADAVRAHFATADHASEPQASWPRRRLMGIVVATSVVAAVAVAALSTRR
jgi:hypothetical protein